MRRMQQDETESGAKEAWGSGSSRVLVQVEVWGIDGEYKGTHTSLNMSRAEIMKADLMSKWQPLSTAVTGGSSVVLAVSLQSEGAGEVVCVDQIRFLAQREKGDNNNKEVMWQALLGVSITMATFYIIGMVMLRRTKLRSTSGYGAAVTFDEDGMGSIGNNADPTGLQRAMALDRGQQAQVNQQADNRDLSSHFGVGNGGGDQQEQAREVELARVETTI